MKDDVLDLMNYYFADLESDNLYDEKNIANVFMYSIIQQL